MIFEVFGLPKDFDDLVNDLRKLKATEDDAKKIVDAANVEAEKIIRDAEEAAASTISKTETEIRRATRGLREEADAEVAPEVNNLETAYAEEIKEIKSKASEKMDEAVSYVLERVLKAEV